MSELLTLQDLANGHLDIKALGEAANGDENTIVTTRTGNTYPSAERAINIMFQNGGLPAEPFATKAEMQTDGASLADGQLAMVYNETDNNGLYVKTAGAWVKSGYDPLTQAKAYADGRLVNYNEVKISTKNLFNPEDVITGSTYDNIGGVYHSGGLRRTIKYPCTAGEWIAISGLSDKGTAFRRMHFWDSLGNFLSFENYPAVESTTAFTIQAPASAAFFGLNLNGSTIPPKLQIEKSPVVTAYEPYRIPFIATMPNYADVFSVKTSSKNLYDGGLNTRYRTIGTGALLTSSDDDVVSSLIPVQSGKTYTISGINPALLNSAFLRILGYKSNTAMITPSSNFTAVVGYASSPSFTITITDAETKYIVMPLSSQGFGTLDQAKSLSLQVEEGSFPTSYEPYQYSAENLKLYNAGIAHTKSAISAVSSKSVGSFTEMDRGRRTDSNVVKFEKVLAPTGISYSVTTDLDSGTNNLYAKVTGVQAGTRVISANLMKLVGSTTTLPTLKGYPFTVPSGQLDNPDTLTEYAANRLNKYNYCHPDIAYDSTGVAGFKYWMVASILPPYSMNDTQWEDEDVFVSNDAKTWQRVRSLYETDKTYTTAELRLPPHNLAQANARRYGLLPCPASGDTIEISVPADNGAPALDRVNITLTELPWKHDPAILIDGGYVYIYHSYHLPYVDRISGRNRFIVCTRTSNGIDWDVVRSDGSTMRITAENSRTLFTKSADGKYNYLYYAYSRGYSNPTVIKYGAGDYELIYGENYSFRIKGTTPYNFDFSVQHPLRYVGSGNHPMAFYDGTSKTYIINNDSIYESTDRGVSFTKLEHYPAWVGGITGFGYKKSLCIGEGGKVILVDTQRYAVPSIAPNTLGNTTTLSDNMMFIYEYPSLTDFINKANNGLVDAYVDFHLCKVNAVSNTRVFKVVNAVGIKSTNTNPNNPLQKIDIVSMDFEDGDVLHIYATLTARNGATVRLGGIDIL